MTHRNRVDPFGALHATPERGLLFGNRGVLHDRHGSVVRSRTTERRWICCLLEFKGRRRTLLQPGRYTELFFLDEATALAAGHRPCLECRRAHGRAFVDALATARPDLGVLQVSRLDALVDPERLRARPLTQEPSSLPDGAMLADGETAGALLVRGGRLWRWTPGGYVAAEASVVPQVMLTPALFLDALAGGYRPLIHPSAG